MVVNSRLMLCSRSVVRMSQMSMRRQYATGYEKRTKETLKVSSRLTWLTSGTAAAAAIAYFYTAAPISTPLSDKIEHTKNSDLEAPKPVEDRHGDTVAKHSMAAHKNQHKVREGVFKGGEFDNHILKHSTNPGKDFEKK